MGVTIYATLDGFFHEVVAETLVEQRVCTSESTTYYLVDLLAELSVSPLPEEPLSLKLARASGSLEESTLLKEVGDTSLYVTGLFTETIEKGIVSRDFYETLGEAAYSRLASSFRGRTALADVYEELSLRFKDFVHVMENVRKRLCIEAPAATERLLLLSKQDQRASQIVEDEKKSA